MRRRDALAAAGAAGGFAGCTGILGGSCGPGEREIGALSDAAAAGDLPSTASVTGTVAQYVEPPRTKVTGKLMVLDDGTGRAVVYPPRAFEFNADVVGLGTCVEVDAELNVSRSRTLELPVLMVRSEGDVSENGRSGRSPETLPTLPSAEFEYEWTQANSYEGAAVTLHHRGGDPVPADRLLVKRQDDHDREEYHWHEAADGVSGDDDVTEGASIHVDAERGALVWDHDERWKRPLVLWPPDRWQITFF